MEFRATLMERGVFERRTWASLLTATVLALLVSTWSPAMGAGGPPGPTANPYIVYTWPADGATGVDPMMNIFLEFNSSMNTSSVTVTIIPAIALTPEWYGDTAVNFTHTTPFASCTLFWIRVNGTDLSGAPLVPGPVPNPWTFTTACPNPFIVATDPSDGAAGVPLSANIVVTFSNPMDTATVVWTISPALTLTSSWNSPTDTILTLSHTTPFAFCTVYTLEIAGQDKSGLPLVPGPYPNPWSFSTACPNPFITSTYPYDGSVNIPVNAAIVVTFSEAMDPSNVTAAITPAVGVLTPAWNPTDTVLTLTHSTPFASCILYTVQVNGTDVGGFPLVPGPVPNPWSFSTACPNPYIVSTTPAAGTSNVSLSRSIVVTFSTSMNTSSVTWTIVPAFALTPSWNGPNATVLTLSHATPFPVCVTITITISGSDLGGLPLVPGPVPNPWSFSTDCGSAPFVTLSAPNGGEDWTGGSPHRIWWNMSDAQDPNTALVVAIRYTTDGGTTYLPIVSGLAGTANPNSYLWTVPAMDSLTVRVQACATDTTALTGCDASNGDFMIDSTPPDVVSTVPLAGATGVSPTAPIVVTFSETMSAASVQGAFSLTPGAAPYTFTWSQATVTITHAPLVPGTAYTAAVGTGARDASDPGNSLASPYSWGFLTLNVPPAISVTAPAGGERWSAGPAFPHTVAWTMGDQESPAASLLVYVNYTSGAGNGPVCGPLTGATTCSWTPPAIDDSNVRIQATVIDPQGARGTMETPPFALDATPPAVTSYAPSGPEAPIDPAVDVAFSEAMRLPQFENFAVFGPPSAPAVTWTLTWSPSHLSFTAALAGTVPCTTYNASVGASLVPEAMLYDASEPGILLAPTLWSFTTVCLPTVDLLAPSGGEDWTGGTVHTIRWTSADLDDTILTAALSYSLDGGADGFPYAIASGLAVAVGTGTYPWTVPTVDSTRVLVRIRVVDGAGNAATDAGTAALTVDSTPPALLVGFPSDGATGHRTTRDIWFVWTERVDRASFQAAFSLSPDPGGLAFTWSVSNLGGDVLLVSHDAFKSKTSYAATFAATAKDDSDPGNPLSAAVVVRFSTQPPPPANPPVALAVGQHQVEVGVPVTFDGTGSTGSIRDYSWRIADNQGGFVAVLVGPKPTYTFQQNGRYSVTLFVTDANGASDDDTIEIAVTSNPHTAGSIALAGALLVAALVGATEAGRVAALSVLLLPVVARRRKDGPEEQETRGMIRGYITGNPGDSYSDIKRNLRLTNGPLLYHLHILERDGIIRSQLRGSRRLFYPREVRLPEDGGGLHEIQLRMLRAVQAVPGLAVTDLAGALGVTSQLALYHLRDLAAKGRIRFERRGFRLRCYPEGEPAPAERPAVEG